MGEIVDLSARKGSDRGIVGDGVGGDGDEKDREVVGHEKERPAQDELTAGDDDEREKEVKKTGIAEAEAKNGHRIRSQLIVPDFARDYLSLCS